jgi:Zn-dependent M28 family amino/carboxypeptidase
MSPSLGSTSSELEAGLVFVGYGIDAPELDYSDYTDINVEGKVVVLVAGQPHDFPSEEGAHFASTTEKTKAAVRGGAVGMVMIHTPRAAQRFQWDRIKSLVGAPSMGWINTSGDVNGVFKQIRGGALINHTAADVLFENVDVDLDSLLERDENGEALGAFDLDGMVSMRQRSTHQDISSPNVIAVLPGSDPLLAGEYVVYSAHLDHIGELHSEAVAEGQGDLINNGALDNASGITSP